MKMQLKSVLIILLYLIFGILTPLLFSACSGFEQGISSKGVEIEGLYYILDDNQGTAKVTYEKIYSQKRSRIAIIHGDENSPEEYISFVETPTIEHEDWKNINYTTLPEKIKIPSSVRYADKEYKVIAIGDSAFMSTTNLKEIILPTSIKSIGQMAFSASGLEKISELTNINSLGKEAFAYTKLRNLILPPLKTIPPLLFYKSLMEELEFSEGTKIIGAAVCSDCRNLTKVSLAPTVETIGIYAFDGCENLEFIELPNTLVKISCGAFAYSGLLCANIPSSVDTIGSEAFKDCHKLEICYMSPNVKVIPPSLFENCPALKELVLYNYDELPKMPGFKDVQNGIHYGIMGDWSKDRMDNAQKFNLLQLTLPRHCEIYNDWEQRMGMPSYVHTSDCAKPKRFYFGELGTPGYSRYPSKIDGIYYDIAPYSQTATVVMPPNQQEWDWETLHKRDSHTYDTTIAIPSEVVVDSVSYTVTRIGQYAFLNYPISGYRVILPPTIKKIDEFAFAYSKLRSIELNDGLEEIATCAFKDTWLTEVTIPKSVKRILNHAFKDNEDLKNIYMYDTSLYLAPSFVSDSKKYSGYSIIQETDSIN